MSNKKVTADQGLIFPELDGARYGDAKRRQNLFLSKFLKKESVDYRLEDEDYHQAQEIMQKWASLEASGKLQAKKETSLEGEFLTEVFGTALGYTKFSEDRERWNLEPKYNVNGGEADAAIGMFEHGRKSPPLAVIEFKGPDANLDRDRFNGRTAVQQCWDYLNALPDCPWGIVCNFVSFRLYHRSRSSREYQLFLLSDMANKDAFRQFYYVFERRALLSDRSGVQPRADVLLSQTGERQREVGNELYESYDRNRHELIHHLKKPPASKSLDQSIRVSQKILDRIIFVAFCEDRDLLPKDTLHKAYSQIPPFDKVTNPRWRNFLNLFRSIDEGNADHDISPFNGGLFRKDDEVDNLQLDDRWTSFFNSIGNYDFRDEVSVDVLGHLFEKSIKDIERMKMGGLFEAERDSVTAPKMTKSAERKRFGIYYTPPEFTTFIVDNTVGRLIGDRFEALAEKEKITDIDRKRSDPDDKMASYWRKCLVVLQNLRIVDPACGSGAFLIKAYDLLEEKYFEVIDNLAYFGNDNSEKLRSEIPNMILGQNLFGVDLSNEAVEISQLALWIRSAEKGETLADLSRNIVCGNSLVDDSEIDANSMVWAEIFPEVFKGDSPGFDCVIGNPPWERMKLQEREFFDAAAPDIASAVNAADRRKLIEQLVESNPDLHDRYTEAKVSAEKNLNHVRASGRYPLTGKGDINTYSVFAELAHSVVSHVGLVGLLVPSGIATDHTTREFFAELIESKSLIGFYDFENKKGIFHDVHRSFKFSVLLFGGSKIEGGTTDFVFFSHAMDELRDKNRHVALSPDDIKLLNPNTKTCPIFRSNRDAEITKSVYRRVPVLVDENRKEGGNPWGVRFFTMFHQTNDAELFVTADDLKAGKCKRDAARWKKGKKLFLPLYEAKMIQMYDHRAASVLVKSENWMRQGQTAETSLVEHQNPEHVVQPRWWVDEAKVIESNSLFPRGYFVGFKDITSPTNQRTMIAAAIPWSGVTNHFPVLLTGVSVRAEMCLLANLNSFSLDYIARQKIGGVTLNFFIVQQLPIFPPDFYIAKCSWHKRQTLEKWISDRVLKLTCTSNDMMPLAEAAGLAPPIHKWKSDERADLMAQLDAAYFLLYEIPRDDVEYILSTFQGLSKSDTNIFGGADATTLILAYYDQFLSSR